MYEGSLFLFSVVFLVILWSRYSTKPMTDEPSVECDLMTMPTHIWQDRLGILRHLGQFQCISPASKMVNHPTLLPPARP